jgi:hypothetical protein
MRDWKRAAACGLWLLPLVWTGCPSADSVPEPTAEEDEHDHHEHHGHGDRQFADGWTEEWAHLQHAAEAGDAQAMRTELAEFREVVLLLPKLAADSDLPRAEWELFQAAMQRLAVACEVQDAALARDFSSSLAPLAEAVRQAEQILNETAAAIERHEKS